MNEKNKLGKNIELPPMGSSMVSNQQNNFSNFSNFNNDIASPTDNNVSVFDLMDQFSNLDGNNKQESTIQNEVQQPLINNNQQQANINPVMPGVLEKNLVNDLDSSSFKPSLSSDIEKSFPIDNTIKQNAATVMPSIAQQQPFSNNIEQPSLNPPLSSDVNQSFLTDNTIKQDVSTVMPNVVQQQSLVDDIKPLPENPQPIAPIDSLFEDSSDSEIQTNDIIENKQNLNNSEENTDIFSLSNGKNGEGMIIPPIITKEENVSEKANNDHLVNTLMNDVSSTNDDNNNEIIPDQQDVQNEKKDLPKKKSHKKVFILIIVIVIVLTVASVLFYFFVFNKNMRNRTIACNIQTFDDNNSYETYETIMLNFKGDKLSSAEIDHNINFYDATEEQKASLLANFKNEYEGRGKDFSSIEYESGVEFIVTYTPTDFKNSFGMGDNDMKKNNILSVLKNSGYTCE